MSLLKIDLPFRIKRPILAVGADIKNSLCFAYNRSAFVSEAISNLELLSNFNKFKKRLTSMPRRFGLAPRIIAHDKHPEYFSTKYILNLPRAKAARLVSVQHHHAHIASCMIENGLSNQRVIGIAFDGTGFGNDRTLWGAEFLIADYGDFQRAAHLRYIPLLGGQKAIFQPWRVSAAWLYLAFGNDFLDFGFFKRINKKDWYVLMKMWEQNFNAPLASSIGRLFDAAAALLLGIHQVKFEAEAAIDLEESASRYELQPKGYQFRIKRAGQIFIIDPVLTFKGIVADLKNKCSKEEIAARFHLTVAQMIRRTCLKIRDDTGINTVVLSGGVFQNKILSRLSLGLLERAGFHIFTHRILSCSDVSVSLGQAAVAAFTN